MRNARSERPLSEILSDLIETPLRDASVDEALQRLVQLCSEARGSKACTLAWVDLEQRLLTQAAYVGFDETFHAFMSQHKFKIGALHEGVTLDLELPLRGEVIRRFNLSENGG